MVSHRAYNMFKKLKRKTLKEYKKEKKEKLVNVIHSQFADYDRLRSICQKLMLENEFLKRKYIYKRRRRLK